MLKGRSETSPTEISPCSESPMPRQADSISRLLGLLLSVIVTSIGSAADDFFAHFTRIESGDDFERFSRTGDDADTVVCPATAEGRLVFWRGTSYLPCWETSRGRCPLPELIGREGDGDAKL